MKYMFDLTNSNKRLKNKKKLKPIDCLYVRARLKWLSHYSLAPPLILLGISVFLMGLVLILKKKTHLSIYTIFNFANFVQFLSKIKLRYIVFVNCFYQ